MTPLLVHGVVRAGATIPGGLRGIRGAPVVRVEHGGLAAVTSKLPGAEAPGSREDIAAHSGVLDALVAVTTVVPLRFGTVMDDEGLVREALLARPEVSALLDSLEGRVQMSLRVFYEGETAVREAAAKDPAVRREAGRLRGLPEHAERDARIRLGERVAADVEALRVADEDMLVRRLGEIADELRVDPPVHEQQVARVHLLVAREKVPELDRAVAKLAAEQEKRLHLRYVGPLPPYSFSDLVLEPAWA